jgi:glycosyltransferase involved in cell wall biosynthesis
MLAGKPVIATASSDSDLADVIHQSGCGWTVRSENPSELAEAIRCMTMLDSAELIRMGHAGREYALARYTTDACLPEITQILEQASNPNARNTET